MKNRNLLGILMLPASILAFAGMFTAAFTIGKENLTALTVAAVIIAVVALIACVVLYKLYTSPGKELETRWRVYSLLPREKITDFSAELEEVRENYNADTNPKKNHVGGNFRAFKGERPVQETGKIYYAHIVEANSALFKKNFSSFTLPAVVVYSKDEYYAQNPYALNETAEYLYANKQNNFLRNEMKYFFNRKMQDKEGREVYVTTIFLHRFHLPDGCLHGALFPVIADPENCKAVFAVDSVYWTDKLIVNFMWHDISIPEKVPKPENGNNDDTFEI